jgi:hypothetical protein
MATSISELSANCATVFVLRHSLFDDGLEVETISGPHCIVFICIHRHSRVSKFGNFNVPRLSDFIEAKKGLSLFSWCHNAAAICFKLHISCLTSSNFDAYYLKEPLFVWQEWSNCPLILTTFTHTPSLVFLLAANWSVWDACPTTALIKHLL